MGQSDGSWIIEAVAFRCDVDTFALVRRVGRLGGRVVWVNGADELPWDAFYEAGTRTIYVTVTNAEGRSRSHRDVHESLAHEAVHLRQHRDGKHPTFWTGKMPAGKGRAAAIRELESEAEDEAHRAVTEIYGARARRRRASESSILQAAGW